VICVIHWPDGPEIRPWGTTIAWRTWRGFAGAPEPLAKRMLTRTREGCHGAPLEADHPERRDGP
jgi:hypothetical protein